VEEIAGLVERVTFFNEESGFSVLRVPGLTQTGNGPARIEEYVWVMDTLTINDQTPAEAAQSDWYRRPGVIYFIAAGWVRPSP
jgi:hypothetical protein